MNKKIVLVLLLLFSTLSVYSQSNKLPDFSFFSPVMQKVIMAESLVSDKFLKKSLFENSNERKLQGYFIYNKKIYYYISAKNDWYRLLFLTQLKSIKDADYLNKNIKVDREKNFKPVIDLFKKKDGYSLALDKKKVHFQYYGNREEFVQNKINKKFKNHVHNTVKNWFKSIRVECVEVEYYSVYCGD